MTQYACNTSGWTCPYLQSGIEGIWDRLHHTLNKQMQPAKDLGPLALAAFVQYLCACSSSYDGIWDDTLAHGASRPWAM